MSRGSGYQSGGKHVKDLKPPPRGLPGIGAPLPPPEDRSALVLCGACREVVLDGAHVVMSPISVDLHVLYCPRCCPCQAGKVQKSVVR